MLLTSRPASGLASTRLRATLSATVAFVALLALSGCAADPAPRVTLTIPAAGNPGTTDPGTTDPGTTDPGTTDPGTTDPGAPDTGEPSIVVTQGQASGHCATCLFVHVKWENLEPGPHFTECVSDGADTGTWSDSTYDYPTADGERDLGCSWGRPNTQVWVVLDGELTSSAISWD